MARPILVENGNWKNLREISCEGNTDLSDSIRRIIEVNDNIKHRLGLREDPLQVRSQAGIAQIRARQISGTISNGPLYFDIAPKFVPEASVATRWSDALLALVKLTNFRHLVLSKTSNLDVFHHNFVDLIALAFYDACMRGLYFGLIRIYREHEARAPVVKGRLNVNRQVKNFVKQPHLVECDLSELDADNFYNAILRMTADRLFRSVWSSSIRNRVYELRNMFPQIPAPSSFASLRIPAPPPQYRAWEDALELANVINRGMVHGRGFGRQRGYTFVFDMERSFERFVEMALRKVCDRIPFSSIKPKTQDRVPYARPIAPNRQTYFTKPDNVIYLDGKPAIVVDAKYKKIKDADSGAFKKPRNDDIYEIVAGMTAHNCRIGLLIYPKMGTNEVEGQQARRSWYIDSFGSKLIVYSYVIDLMALTSLHDSNKMYVELASFIEEIIDSMQT